MIWNHHPSDSRCPFKSGTRWDDFTRKHIPGKKDYKNDRRPQFFWMISGALLSQKKHVCRLGENHPIFLLMVHQGGRGTFWTSQVGQLCRENGPTWPSQSRIYPRNLTFSPLKNDGKGRWGNPFGSKPIFRGELSNFWGVDVLRFCRFGGWKKRSPEAKLVFYYCSLGKWRINNCKKTWKESVISIWNVCIFLKICFERQACRMWLQSSLFRLSFVTFRPSTWNTRPYIPPTLLAGPTQMDVTNRERLNNY